MMRPPSSLALSALAALLLLLPTEASAQEDRRTPAPVKKPERDESFLFFDVYSRGAVSTKSVGGLSDWASTFELGLAATITTGRESRLQGIYEADLSIGGGDSDVSGVARMYGWVGVSPAKRGPVRPFLRLGTGFDVRGNDYFLHSHVDIPATQLGFRVLRNDMYFDAGAFSAYTGTGRFNVDGNERKLDGALAWGGFVETRGDSTFIPFIGRAEFRSYGDTLASPGVRAWSLKACTTYEKFVVFCMDGMTASGVIRADDGPHESWAFSGGLSVGLGYLAPTREL